MATNVTFNGTIYSVPAEGDSNWGTALSNYFIAIASGALQKTGGTFTLTAETDFGGSFGLKALYVKSRATNPASAGIFRLGNNENISWRNAANNANLSLSVDATDTLNFNGSSISIGGDPVQTEITVSDTDTIDMTLSAADISAIVVDGSLENVHIAADAAIAYSKLNLADSIVNADIASGAAIALSKLATVTASRALVSDGSGVISASSVTATELGLLSGRTGTLATLAETQTLTNKTIVVANNTVTTAASGNLAATELNTALAELQTDIDTRALDSDLDAHISDSSGAHAASAISFSATGSIAATDAQAAIAEVSGDIDGHIADASGAHAATAISYDNGGGPLSATDVQDAIDEIAASGGAIPDPSGETDGKVLTISSGTAVWDSLPLEFISETVASPTTSGGTEVTSITNVTFKGTRIGKVYHLATNFTFALGAQGNYTDAMLVALSNFSFLSGKTVNYISGSFNTNVNDSSSPGKTVTGKFGLSTTNINFEFFGQFIAVSGRSGTGTLAIVVD